SSLSSSTSSTRNRDGAVGHRPGPSVGPGCCGATDARVTLAIPELPSVVRWFTSRRQDTTHNAVSTSAAVLFLANYLHLHRPATLLAWSSTSTSKSTTSFGRSVMSFSLGRRYRITGSGNRPA